ncbi:glycosyl hydrolase family 76 protein [Colletotrichum tofieldiae]|nr:glycosyl hydrolase family 76 protein [Colletotrichum tofieldiae]
MNEKGKGIDNDASSDGASSRENGILSPPPLKGQDCDVSNERHNGDLSPSLGIPMVREKRLSRKNKDATLRNSVASRQSARIE